MDTKTIDFIEEFRNADIKSLALRSSKYRDIDLQYALTQISGYQAIKEKVSFWANNIRIIYPRHLSLEQCSSEKTAHYKHSVIKRLLKSTSKMIDLTGGFGVDFAFMSNIFKESVYVERQEELCDIARHNFPILGLQGFKIVCCDGANYLRQMEAVDFIFLDPARRNTKGEKTVFIEDCEPNVAELMPLLVDKCRFAMIKLSPMLDLHHIVHSLKSITEIHVVATKNECKETLAIISHDAEGEPDIICTNDDHSFVFRASEEETAQCLYSENVEKYIYEPNAALLKAGAFKLLAARFELKKLHPNSHLYTGHILVETFPGRIFEVEKVSNFNKKELNKMLGDIKQANLTVRNFPSTVAELRKKLKLQDGGKKYLFATTLSNGTRTLIMGTKA